MVIHVWSVLCQRTIVNADTNNPTLIEAIELISLPAPQIPEGTQAVVVPFEAELISLWVREDIAEGEALQGRVSIALPNGVATNPMPFEIDLRENHRLYTRVKFSVLPIVAPGYCWFVVELERDDEWREAARVPVEIAFLPPRITNEPPPPA